MCNTPPPSGGYSGINVCNLSKETNSAYYVHFSVTQLYKLDFQVLEDFSTRFPYIKHANP